MAPALRRHARAPRATHRRGRAGRRPAAGAESQAVIVLGIDPGLASTGYGVVAGGGAAAGARPRALDGGVLATSASSSAERRLTQIFAGVAALLEEHAPDAVALEELYFGANARSAFAVGQARGVVMLAAGQRGLPCFGYTPQQVKAAVCGNGRAQKDQVARMVAVLLGLREPPHPDHAADALAVAVCHLNRAPLQSALAAAGDAARGGDRAVSGAGVGAGAGVGR
jgi:crossover junction endodeoxyribonuclease RuvC